MMFAPLSLSTGIPLPYSPQTDDGLAILLLCCFFLSAHVLSRSRKFLFQLGKDFLFNRERTSIFATSTAADMRYLLLLILQTFVLTGVCIYTYTLKQMPALLQVVAPPLLLICLIAVCLFYFALKWAAYLFLGWIFFDKQQTSFWLESYSTLLYYLGFTLFPFTLLAVYFDLNLHFVLIFGLILYVFSKILMLYKWLKLFCDNLHGCLLLILYFCALEIIPTFLMYRGMVQLTECLIIKI
ncbi:MAG: DUF4271 domain-containing protein [Bacteroides sp.]|nr:DUF4271 domain-containing protein [Bacteroides sp.]